MPINTTESLYKGYVMPTYGRFDVKLVRGEGCKVWDEGGREYLDFGAGIAVCSLGHSHPRIAGTLSRQARTLMHTSNLYYTREQGELAKVLVERVIGHEGKVFFCNSGGEANEAMIKLARRVGNLTTPGERYEIITFNGSFHGRTLAGIAATGQDKVKRGFEPIVPGFTHVPWQDRDAVLGAITPKTIGILLEPIQGEGGIHVSSVEFLQFLRQVCDEHKLLLMFDEIQCGLGRTGEWCGWRSLVTDGSVEPDMVSWAKGIACGFPMGAMYARQKTLELLAGGEGSLDTLLSAGTHGTTYGGNPLACATALEVFRVIEEEGLLASVKELETYAVDALRAVKSPYIQEVRGRGLMLGIELVETFLEKAKKSEAEGTPALQVVKLLQRKGLLCIPAGTNVVRWLPPLNVSRTDIDQAVSILSTVLKELP